MSDDAIRRARRHEAAGELDQALAAYREVGPDEPRYGEARIRIVGLLLLQGRPDEAEREARAFVAACPEAADAHATLGQMLRLAFRHEEAIASLERAVKIAPATAGYRMLLNDARRARYWTPDAVLWGGLAELVGGGGGSPSARYRFFHLQCVGILSPDVQQWLTDTAAIEAQPAVPDSLRRALDGKFDGRFSMALDEVRDARRAVAAPGSPYAPAAARVTQVDGGTIEGPIEDSDGTIAGALEAIDGAEYALLPFGELAAIEFVEPGPYVRARVTPRAGRAREVEVPALYVFTEGCRIKALREGSLTVWRTLADGLSVGLGLRDFVVTSKGARTLVGIDRVRRVEFG